MCAGQAECLPGTALLAAIPIKFGSVLLVVLFHVKHKTL